MFVKYRKYFKLSLHIIIIIECLLTHNILTNAAEGNAQAF